MDTNTKYTFEELFETAETAVVNFVGLAENLQHIVIDCGKHGHAIKIFSNNVEVFSNELDKKLVRALHYLARLETLFKWEYNIPVNEDVQ